MTDSSATTQRVLRLLSLLQARPVWTGPELAGRLGVTTRSIRRDVERQAGADHLETLALHLVGIGFDLAVLEPPELREVLGRLGARMAAAAAAETVPDNGAHDEDRGLAG